MIPKALRALVGVACLTGCATSAGTASLADGRTGTFSILTLTYPTRPGAIEQPASVTGDLSLPAGSGRVPAVIVLHSCAGVTPEIGDWARTLNGMGYAALVVDSFTARGVTEVCTGHQSINPGSRLADLFRAHELLATHPRIDPQRIAVLGFAYGGWITLWASHDWYQRRFMRGTVPTPAAYAAFYPAGCNVRLLQEADVHAPVRIFHGTEADILADGAIDFGDEFLGVFDLVVASVHSRFGLPREAQTARLLRAVRNPRVSVLGHPTGRLLLSRDGMNADIEAVVDAAAESGCALEINGSPERLDLDWRHCRRAVERGALLSIGPDAHSVTELGLVSLAVGIARKGWVTPEATLNARSAGELEAWLGQRRGTPLPEP